jgi:hypothetical protein
MRRCICAVYKVGHRLGLAQVQPAGKKCLTGKLAWLCQTGTAVQQSLKQGLLNKERTMAGELDRVQPSVGMGGMETGNHNLVH